MILMVTNCIGYGVPIPPERLWRGEVQHSLFTEGLVYLLRGGRIRPDGPQGIEWEPRYTFEAIDLAEVEAIVWSPFIDQTGYYPSGVGLTFSGGWKRPPQRYPYSDTPMVEKVGSDDRPDLNEVYRWWRELEQLTRRIPVRLLILYPTTFLDRVSPAHAGLTSRVLRSTAAAVDIFEDWTHLSVAEPVLDTSGWWAHLTYECRKELLDDIARRCEPQPRDAA